MPWKGEKNPYLIWLSEIILQQTRVEQGLPYFERFRKKYPTIYDLANSTENEVLKLWEGLGYYSRARNLHHTARYIVEELGGKFPDNYNSIRKLKGVGDYTAAAIASFAFDLPHAVVDGNVYRVLSRYFANDTPIDTTYGKKLFASYANQLLDPEQPAAFNQAMMDLGAKLCTPYAPQCRICPLAGSCEAKKKEMTLLLPIKQKKLERKKRFLAYLHIWHRGGFYICQRTGDDIWKKLFELPCVEIKKPLQQVDELIDYLPWLKEHNVRSIVPVTQIKHILTHQWITAIFYEVQMNDAFCPPEEECWQWVRSSAELMNYAFPKLILKYFQQKTLNLEL